MVRSALGGAQRDRQARGTVFPAINLVKGFSVGSNAPKGKIAWSRMRGGGPKELTNKRGFNGVLMKWKEGKRDFPGNEIDTQEKRIN
jgi:hypothetical protein